MSQASSTHFTLKREILVMGTKSLSCRFSVRDRQWASAEVGPRLKPEGIELDMKVVRSQSRATAEQMLQDHNARCPRSLI